jgi:hypothetical protein
MEGEAGSSPSIAREGVRSSLRPIGHDWVYSGRLTDRLRERLNRSPSSLSRSDGEPARPQPVQGCAAYGDAQSPERRTHRGVTVGAGGRAVQDTIGPIEVRGPGGCPNAAVPALGQMDPGGLAVPAQYLIIVVVRAVGTG